MYSNWVPASQRTQLLSVVRTSRLMMLKGRTLFCCGKDTKNELCLQNKDFFLIIELVDRFCYNPTHHTCLATKGHAVMEKETSLTSNRSHFSFGSAVVRL
jgi:hypothetical protein